MTDRRRFADRVCLVTGSTGMAAAAATALAAEGASVFVCSRTAEHVRSLADAIAGAGGRSGWLAADLRREEDVEAAVRACVSAFSRLDCVYNVAGISGRRFGDGPLHELTADGWATVLEANATSTFLVSRAAVRQMLGQEPRPGGGRGSVLNMSSVLAQSPSRAHFATHAYAASKGAIEAFTRAAAAYYAADGIRFNVIAPALVATPMSERAQRDPATLEYLSSKQPLAGGPIAADDVTATALYLLSEDARMVTGQVIAVDGGWTVSEPRPRSGPR